MSTRRDRRPEALALDEGVLREERVCEFGSDLAVASMGGIVVQPWRDRYLATESEGLEVVSSAASLPDASFPQVVVHLQKSRAATFCDLAEAWRLLAPGGRLLFVGTNSLGVVSAVKRLAKQLDQKPIVVANRARARVARFERDGGPGPRPEDTPSLDLEVDGGSAGRFELELETRPGVFSAKRLDAGTQLLLETLPGAVGRKPPKRVVDLGCGTGVLDIAAARLWPDCEVWLADADARAVDCARANVERTGLAARVRVLWWDAREAVPDTRFDLALVNPPFHRQGMEVDLGPALALFDSLGRWLKPGGRALLVANRTLPYEAPLSEFGELSTLQAARGYKVLSLDSLRRRARSSGARGRSAPGARSAGRSRAPTRSR